MREASQNGIFWTLVINASKPLCCRLLLLSEKKSKYKSSFIYPPNKRLLVAVVVSDQENATGVAVLH
jgi:hypothetical protein